MLFRSDNSYQLAMNGTFMGAQKIRNYIRLYPSIPMFKNHLWQYQILVGHLDMAEEAALLAVQEHPGYFYSRLMVANLAQQGEDTNSLILELVGRGVR